MSVEIVEWRCGRCRDPLPMRMMAPVGFYCPRCQCLVCSACAGRRTLLPRRVDPDEVCRACAEAEGD